ncbi:MAG TPA: HD domain-containing protein [Selenomonadales bacterium]|nr:HD domain-containing protein [Selenomonadales bacterium]
MAVQMVAVKDLMPGSVLGDSVLSANGKILLGKDVVLTQRNIALLNAWDVKCVYVNAAVAETPAEEPAKEVKPASSRTDKFYQEYDSIVTNTMQAFDFIRKQKIIPLPLLKDTAGHIRTSVTDNSSVITNYLLVSDHKVADFISRHSAMVGYFAAIIACQMKWSDEDVRGVALAGLLHDVGNVAAGRTAESRQTNIAEAAALLKEVKGLSSQVILGVIQHREYIDGSGHPMGVNGLKIHPYAKIIAVADTFHTQAYTAEYANPFPVLDLLAHEMFGKLDPAVCHVFINRIRDSLLRNKILLKNGQEAEVIYFHPTGSCLPVVRTADNKIVDLSQHGSAVISRIVAPN